MIESCGTCRFWSGVRVVYEYWMDSELSEDNVTVGYCRKYAPAPVQGVSNSKRPSWPETRTDYWCGEWQFHNKGRDVIDAAAH